MIASGVTGVCSDIGAILTAAARVSGQASCPLVALQPEVRTLSVREAHSTVKNDGR